MHQIFESCVLVSDLDGTMITEKFTIPQSNIDAVRRFRSMGGRIALATGRSPRTTRQFAQQLGCDLPCIVFNGSGVYDFKQDKFIWKCQIDKCDGVDLLKAVLAAFPYVGIEVWCESGICQLNPDYQQESREEIEGVHFLECTADELPDKWYKVLISGEPEIIPTVWDFCRARTPQGITSVCSGPLYCELLNSKASKAEAFRQMLLIENLPEDCAAAIGDYYNDLSLLEFASVSACPINAVDEVKQIADYIVCDCHEGAPAHFISILEQNASS